MPWTAAVDTEDLPTEISALSWLVSLIIWDPDMMLIVNILYDWRLSWRSQMKGEEVRQESWLCSWLWRRMWTMLKKELDK